MPDLIRAFGANRSAWWSMATFESVELVLLIDGSGEYPAHLFASHPCLHGAVPQGSHDDDNQRICQPLELRNQYFVWANLTFKQATVLEAVVASGTFLPSSTRRCERCALWKSRGAIVAAMRRQKSSRCKVFLHTKM
jgi:hypothetical protein